MRISDWSSDVCSSDLERHEGQAVGAGVIDRERRRRRNPHEQRRLRDQCLVGHLEADPRGDEQEAPKRCARTGDMTDQLVERVVAADIFEDGEDSACGIVPEMGRATCWERGGQYV